MVHDKEDNPRSGYHKIPKGVLLPARRNEGCGPNRLPREAAGCAPTHALIFLWLWLRVASRQLIPKWTLKEELMSVGTCYLPWWQLSFLEDATLSLRLSFACFLSSGPGFLSFIQLLHSSVSLERARGLPATIQ